MVEWFVSNGANLVIGVIVLAVVGLAGRHVYKTRQSGGCSGCPSSSGCGGGCCEPGHKGQ